MSAIAPYVVPGRAFAVVRRAATELQRQARDGMLQHAGQMDETGHIHIVGTLDLAWLANVISEELNRRGFV